MCRNPSWRFITVQHSTLVFCCHGPKVQCHDATRGHWHDPFGFTGNHFAEISICLRGLVSCAGWGCLRVFHYLIATLPLSLYQIPCLETGGKSGSDVPNQRRGVYPNIRREEHNQTESRLLVFAVLMVLTTFCFHANDALLQILEKSAMQNESTRLLNACVTNRATSKIFLSWYVSV